MKKLLTFFIATFITISAFSQAVIQFENKTHDFGQINEVDGKVTHEFVFKNVGNMPLVINKVQASCGCTTPQWTKIPIEPGKTGSIIATYNPAGRKNNFSSSVTVTSNAAESQERLILRGNIVPKNMEQDFSESIETLLLKTKTVQVNNVDKGKSQRRTIAVKNAGKSPLQMSFANVPGYLVVAATPEILQPNQEGLISITFNSLACNQWGEVVGNVHVLLNGQKTHTDENRIRVIANVVEDFSKLTIEQKRNAPILELNTHSVNFGTLKTNTKYSEKFSIKNSGVNPLEIRRVTNANKEISLKFDKLSINSGKKIDAKIDLNTNGLPIGTYRKTITLQTNDPQNNFVVVELLWKIEKK